MRVVCLDLEGVLVPEIWIAFAESTGIEELRMTTRDISDYDELMSIIDDVPLTQAQLADMMTIDDDEKDDMLYKLEKIRKDHKAAILSYEIAFHQKLAEVCRQRDEYAEVADHLREKITKLNVFE